MNKRIRELADQCRTEYRDGHGGFTEQFDEEKFAELIAAEEREACATICDVEADEFGGMSDGFYAAKNCAAAIRARGGE